MNKKFDCVAMKHAIQKKLLQEERSLSLEERRKRLEAAIDADPILSRFWKSSRPAGRGDETEKGRKSA